MFHRYLPRTFETPGKYLLCAGFLPIIFLIHIQPLQDYYAIDIRDCALRTGLL